MLASIDQGVLLALFGWRLHDRRTLALIAQLLDAGETVYRHPLARVALGPAHPPAEGRGLPLGGYLSHWSGGFYLDGLDHFVKRELKIAGYLRYMDDFVLFGDHEAALCEAAERIADWLASQRRLILKDPDARPVSNQRSDRRCFSGFACPGPGSDPVPRHGPVCAGGFAGSLAATANTWPAACKPTAGCGGPWGVNDKMTMAIVNDSDKYRMTLCQSVIL